MRPGSDPSVIVQEISCSDQFITPFYDNDLSGSLHW